MPIIQLPEGKRLKAKNTDLDTLKRTTGAIAVSDEVKLLLKKVKREGATLYVWVNPFTVQISGPPTLCGGIDKEAEMNRYYDRAEDV